MAHTPQRDPAAVQPGLHLSACSSSSRAPAPGCRRASRTLCGTNTWASTPLTGALTGDCDTRPVVA